MKKSEFSAIYKLEEKYWWYRGLHELVENCIKPPPFFSASPNILDAGCGTGGMLLRLKKHGVVEGVDVSQEAIDFCNIRNLHCVQMRDLNTYEPGREKYDIIVCLDVLYHSGIIDDVSVLEKFYKAIKPGGFLFLNLPAFECLRREHDIVVSTARRYRRKTFIKTLKTIGFEIKISSYRLPFLFVYILLNKFFRKIFKIETKALSDLKLLPTPINKILLLVNKTENKIIRKGIIIPFGSSLFIVASKKSR